ncbi:MAG: Lrp/AsnC family transcriptional regulator [Candidatus Bathyarchaeota archaeon]|nr:Lrp/AsnC family transcriptional regulator [Candidatus Bathyarchaeota archaeon]
MDQIDLKILQILKENARAKYVEIARKVGLTEGAVRRRIKQLKEEGVIKRFTIETSIDFEGIVLVETEPAKTREVTWEIKKITDRVFEVSGEYDIAALIQAYTIEDLNAKIDEIRNLPWVLNTKTLIKLKD